MSADEEYRFRFTPRPETEDSRRHAAEMRREGRSLDEWFSEHGADEWPELSGGRLPYPVRVRFGQDKFGKLAVVGLKIDGGEDPFPITASSLRLVGAAISGALRQIGEHRAKDEWLEDDFWRYFGPVLERASVPFAGAAIHPGRRGHSEEFLRQVAEGYAAAVSEDPQRPYSLLARRLFRSEAQTRRLVKRALEHFPELGPADRKPAPERKESE